MQIVASGFGNPDVLKAIPSEVRAPGELPACYKPIIWRVPGNLVLVYHTRNNSCLYALLHCRR